MALALVTGASRGIGRATAILLAREGYTVAVNYHQNVQAADEVVNLIKASGGKAFTVQADVGDEAQVEAMFARLDQQQEPLTALVNNAGILFTQSRVEALSAERINRVLKTNVTGYFLCCREAVKRMTLPLGGAIVNVSSAAARLGAPFEYVDYAASKGAVDTLTTGLALEVAAQGIRVNAVRPGAYLYRDACLWWRARTGGSREVDAADAAWRSAGRSGAGNCLAVEREGVLCDGEFS
ncbi:3-oxoacyl-[acyl-carrier-protein] reductase FabG [Kluyvera intermedia]|nr:3-oxoacyl-[acyl-carrier-protein] reductase FabG [Kluyvera intermedia]